MEDDETKLVDIGKDSDEWKKVEEKMNVKVWDRYQHFTMWDKACKNTRFKVIKLQRIQNKKFWRRYMYFQQKLIKCKYEEIKIEMNIETKNLFHSTGKMIPEEIIRSKHGFDKNYSNPNNFLGPGIYLAVNADYSHFWDNKLFCHKVNPDDEDSKEYKMLMVRAITGFYERKKKIKQEENGKYLNIGMPKSKETGLIWDSVRDQNYDAKLENKWKKLKEDKYWWSVMYMVPEDEQVYPEYLITYEEDELKE